MSGGRFGGRLLAGPVSLADSLRNPLVGIPPKRWPVADSSSESLFYQLLVEENLADAGVTACGAGESLERPQDL